MSESAQFKSASDRLAIADEGRVVNKRITGSIVTCATPRKTIIEVVMCIQILTPNVASTLLPHETRLETRYQDWARLHDGVNSIHGTRYIVLESERGTDIQRLGSRGRVSIAVDDGGCSRELDSSLGQHNQIGAVVEGVAIVALARVIQFGVLGLLDMPFSIDADVENRVTCIHLVGRSRRGAHHFAVNQEKRDGLAITAEPGNRVTDGQAVSH